MQSYSSPYFAAVDLGSNSFHMLIVRLSDTKIEIVDREKEMVQIARGLDRSSLSDEAQQRAIECLKRFSERLRDIPNEQIRAVGTKTLRAAKNAKQFLNDASAALGAPIQIISGYEEARLVYTGLAHTVSDINNQRLVVDIGGGSTEFIIGKAYKPITMKSLGLGCVTFTENYLATGVTKENMRRVYVAACTELQQIRRIYQKHGWTTAFGTSGTMKAIAELLEGEDGGAIISRVGLARLTQDTIENGGVIASGIPKLRREVLPAGMAILEAIFDTLDIEEIRVADATLKEGLIYDTIGRFSDHDTRVETVAQLQEQYNIDKPQATRISKTALNLWQQIDGPKIPGVSRTKILDWAAQLHEVGLNISHSGYHHHGYYILRHSDLAGFGRYEQYILANLVKFHRKKINLAQLEGMNESVQDGFRSLLTCLRIAVVLNRRREDLDQLPELEVDEHSFTLTFNEGWLKNHPFTQAGLLQEAHYLKNMDVKLSLI